MGHCQTCTCGPEPPRRCYNAHYGQGKLHQCEYHVPHKTHYCGTCDAQWTTKEGEHLK